MVFESLIDPIRAERRPWNMIILGFFYSSIAIFLSLWLFEDHGSLVIIFLTVLACTHLMYNTIKLEEEKDLRIVKESRLLKEHSKALMLFICLFLGFVISFSFWFTVLPEDTSLHLFGSQVNIIREINSPATGRAIDISSSFTNIFFNNLKVLTFCLMFAFFYGIGAIFILAWNASVVGTAIGIFVKESVYDNLFVAYSVGTLRYVIHGLPEMFAYFMAGLAGGIISIAIIKHDFKSIKFNRILFDSVDLVIGSIFVLFIAALIEIFITPALFY